LQIRTKARARRSVAGLSALAAFACLCGAAFAQTKIDPSRGAAKAAACAACHGSARTSALSGMPYLNAQQPEFLVLQMFFIREGLRDVPQMRGMLNGFTDTDLNEVAAHFASQPPAEPSGKVDPKLQARGEALAKSMGCGSCHMPGFEGQRQMPRITNQREDYLAETLKAYRDNKRSGSDTSMNAVMYQVSDSDIAALAHFLAHRK
jgi:cytochrome c553